jgi:hypothetical protein
MFQMPEALPSRAGIPRGIGGDVGEGGERNRQAGSRIRHSIGRMPDGICRVHK